MGQMSDYSKMNLRNRDHHLKAFTQEKHRPRSRVQSKRVRDPVLQRIDLVHTRPTSVAENLERESVLLPVGGKDGNLRTERGSEVARWSWRLP